MNRDDGKSQEIYQITYELSDRRRVKAIFDEIWEHSVSQAA